MRILVVAVAVAVIGGFAWSCFGIAHGAEATPMVCGGTLREYVAGGRLVSSEHTFSVVLSVDRKRLKGLPLVIANVIEAGDKLYLLAPKTYRLNSSIVDWAAGSLDRNTGELMLSASQTIDDKWFPWELSLLCRRVSTQPLF